jgi:exosortase
LHIVLVVPLAIALAYNERKSVFRETEPGSLYAGGTIIALTAAHLGLRAGIVSVPLVDRLFVSVILLVTLWISAFSYCFGISATRRASFPLFCLYLMAPLPEAVVAWMTTGLQHASADAAALLFDMTGVPFIRHGQFFTLATQQIEVARECSGIRSSIALLMVALVFGYSFLQTTWARMLFSAAILPLAILKNGLRIYTLSVLATYVDSAYLGGELHRRGGVVFLSAALLALFLMLFLLRKLEGSAWVTRRTRHFGPAQSRLAVGHPGTRTPLPIEGDGKLYR